MAVDMGAIEELEESLTFTGGESLPSAPAMSLLPGDTRSRANTTLGTGGGRPLPPSKKSLFDELSGQPSLLAKVDAGSDLAGTLLFLRSLFSFLHYSSFLHFFSAFPAYLQILFFYLLATIPCCLSYLMCCCLLLITSVTPAGISPTRNLKMMFFPGL